MVLIIAFQLLILLLGQQKSFGGWIDPDTLAEHHVIYPFDRSAPHEAFQLVFSDEFNVPDRNFHDGHDPRWTSIHKDDYTNYALQYYNGNLVHTSNGFLNITTVVEDVTYTVSDSSIGKYSKTKNYQSGMVQGWDKFCFTGGIVEISAQLPGDWNKGGLWPAMWLLGNLARATYVGSSNNIWPWSFEKCDPSIQSQQLFSACNVVNHFGLHSRQGRGAPEIDILEAMAGNETLYETPIHRPYFSASYQVAPGVRDYRPEPAFPPDLTQWYESGLEYGEDSALNIFFYGMHLDGITQDRSYLADAISANRNLYSEHFTSQHTYRLEWSLPNEAGNDGESYLSWYLDGEFVYRVSSAALRKTNASMPHEPMYLILNTAVSSTWGFPQPCPEGCPCDCFDCRHPECLCAVPADMCSMLPASFLVDYVRVYQNTKKGSNHTVGCSPPSHPTKRFIASHADLYIDSSSDDSQPLKPIQHGGGGCRMDSDCGIGGSCREIKSSWAWLVGDEKRENKKVHRCHCPQNGNYTGPTCKAAVGFDDIDWDPPESALPIYWMHVTWNLIFLLLLLALGLVAVTWAKIHHDRTKRQVSRVGSGETGGYVYSPVPTHVELSSYPSSYQHQLPPENNILSASKQYVAMGSNSSAFNNPNHENRQER